MEGTKNLITLRVAYYGDDLTKYTHVPTLYLDGPKCTISGLSWRAKVLEILRKQDFKHVVIIPECRQKDGKVPYGTDEFYAWETYVMNMATMIAFWMPRDSKIFPARDMNDRWGHYKHNKNVILGYPPRTANVDYQGWYAKTHGITMLQNLENIVMYCKAVLDQFNNLKFTVSDGGVITMPENEEMLSNVFVGKMIARMGRTFAETVRTIHVPWTNPRCLEVINQVTNNLYIPSGVCANRGVFILERRNDDVAQEPSSSEIIPRATETIPSESVEKLREILLLKAKLGITDTRLNAEDDYDRSVIDNDNNRIMRKH